MKLRAFDIPSDPSQLPAWLDEQLASHYLPGLVTELLALRDLPLAPPAPIAIRDWLGDSRDAVLKRGTAALSVTQRRELLQRPWLLLALQEEIDLEGGSYWNDVAKRSPETVAAVERGRAQFAVELAALENDQKTPRAARHSMDRIVDKLVSKLRSGQLS